MPENKKEIIIVQISDIHVGESEFVPSLLTRCVDEINELKPDIALITGDLTGMGYRREYETVKNYISPIKCKNLIIQPGNHDSRNVGYMHFEDIFGERYKSYKTDDLIIVAADSSEPDLDNGQIGREYYKWIKNEFKDSEPEILKVFMMHHHLIPIPNTGRERNIVNDAGDVLEVLVDSEVDLVLCGHKHVPYIWRVEDLYILTAGTVSSLRLRGKIEPNYNIIYIREDEIDIYRRYPFDRVEKILGLRRKTVKSKLNDRFVKASPKYK
ncbi:MAG: metallophosphoesterase [Actinobacteria bacterium]|nr:metallophosphoesterase [Actinomycetota bacterium]MBM3712793.1 metallophosphoesterase [Actinomycetota bacterium]